LLATNLNLTNYKAKSEVTKMVNLILYGTESSPPVRAVLLTLRALQLEHEFRPLDMQAGDHLKPEMLRKNPQHTVPMLEDGESCIWDSHAIIAYLVNKYAGVLVHQVGGNGMGVPKDSSVVVQYRHRVLGVLLKEILLQMLTRLEIDLLVFVVQIQGLESQFDGPHTGT